MDGWLERYRRRLARDDGASEVVAYTLMFAMGATALAFSMEVLVDTQEAGAEIATARQVNQIGQMTSTLVHDAARAAQSAPNATFTTSVNLPGTLQGQNYTIRLFVRNQTADPSSPPCPTNPEVHVASGVEDVGATVRLANLTTSEVLPGTCLALDTDRTVASSADALRVKYERTADGPLIRLESANR